MSPPPGLDLDILKRKAMLLLRRERELSQFRQERARTEAWLTVFHALSLELQGYDDRVLVERWAALLVEDLGFQIAGAYRRDPSDPRHVLVCSEPPSCLGAAVRAGDGAMTILEAHAGGRYPSSDADADAPMQPLARDLRLGTFHWLHLPLEGRAVLLVAGCSPEAAPFHELTDVDQAQFVLLGHHLGALLKSVWLTASLSKERTELQRTNEELERANARTRAEMNERLALEKRVRHAQKLEALGRLTAGISHEVNNPLSCVLSNLRFCVEAIDDLHRDGSGVAELRAAAGDALDGAERIGRIVRDVMQFARAEDARLTSVDVRRALDVATHVCQSEIARHARLLTEFQEVAPVHADAQRLQQVFVNLLTNAAQAMNDRPGGTIRIVVRGEAGHVCVEVHDEGSGIPAEIADYVCDPFFTTRPVGKGTGLGLWVCRNILESFGGRLELGRSASGGTMACVFLQAVGPQPPSTPAGNPRRPVSTS